MAQAGAPAPRSPDSLYEDAAARRERKAQAERAAIAADRKQRMFHVSGHTKELLGDDEDDRFEMLYADGLARQENLRKTREQRELEEEEELTFEPKISSYAASIQPQDSIEVRTVRFESKRREGRRVAQEEQLKEEMKDCTFAPKLNKVPKSVTDERPASFLATVAIEERERRQRAADERRKWDEVNNCTFVPEVSDYSRTIVRNADEGDIYNRLYDEATKIKRHKDALIKEHQEDKTDHLTGARLFKPTINYLPEKSLDITTSSNPHKNVEAVRQYMTTLGTRGNVNPEAIKTAELYNEAKFRNAKRRMLDEKEHILVLRKANHRKISTASLTLMRERLSEDIHRLALGDDTGDLVIPAGSQVPTSMMTEPIMRQALTHFGVLKEPSKPRTAMKKIREDTVVQEIMDFLEGPDGKATWKGFYDWLLEVFDRTMAQQMDKHGLRIAPELLGLKDETTGEINTPLTSMLYNYNDALPEDEQDPLDKLTQSVNFFLNDQLAFVVLRNAKKPAFTSRHVPLPEEPSFRPAINPQSAEMAQRSRALEPQNTSAGSEPGAPPAPRTDSLFQQASQAQEKRRVEELRARDAEVRACTFKPKINSTKKNANTRSRHLDPPVERRKVVQSHHEQIKKAQERGHARREESAAHRPRDLLDGRLSDEEQEVGDHMIDLDRARHEYDSKRAAASPNKTAASDAHKEAQQTTTSTEGDAAPTGAKPKRKRRPKSAGAAAGGAPSNPPGFEMAVGRLRYTWKLKELQQQEEAERARRAEEERVAQKRAMPKRARAKKEQQQRQSFVENVPPEAPVLFVDVKLGPGKVGRIAVHRGDDPAALAHNFSLTHELSDRLRDKLASIVAAQIENYEREQQRVLEKEVAAYRAEQAAQNNNNSVNGGQDVSTTSDFYARKQPFGQPSPSPTVTDQGPRAPTEYNLPNVYTVPADPPEGDEKATVAPPVVERHRLGTLSNVPGEQPTALRKADLDALIAQTLNDNISLDDISDEDVPASGKKRSAAVNAAREADRVANTSSDDEALGPWRRPAAGATPGSDVATVVVAKPAPAATPAAQPAAASQPAAQTAPPSEVATVVIPPKDTPAGTPAASTPVPAPAANPADIATVVIPQSQPAATPAPAAAATPATATPAAVITPAVAPAPVARAPSNSSLPAATTAATSAPTPAAVARAPSNPTLPTAASTTTAPPTATTATPAPAPAAVARAPSNSSLPSVGSATTTSTTATAPAPASTAAPAPASVARAPSNSSLPSSTAPAATITTATPAAATGSTPALAPSGGSSSALPPKPTTAAPAPVPAGAMAPMRPLPTVVKAAPGTPVLDSP